MTIFIHCFMGVNCFNAISVEVLPIIALILIIAVSIILITLIYATIVSSCYFTALFSYFMNFIPLFIFNSLFIFYLVITQFISLALSVVIDVTNPIHIFYWQGSCPILFRFVSFYLNLLLKSVQN